MIDNFEDLTPKSGIVDFKDMAASSIKAVVVASVLGLGSVAYRWVAQMTDFRHEVSGTIAALDKKLDSIITTMDEQHTMIERVQQDMIVVKATSADTKEVAHQTAKEFRQFLILRANPSLAKQGAVDPGE